MKESTLNRIEMELLSSCNPSLVYKIVSSIRRRLSEFERNVENTARKVADSIFDDILSQYLKFEEEYDKSKRGDISLTERTLLFLRSFFGLEENMELITKRKFGENTLYGLVHGFITSDLELSDVDLLFEVDKIAEKIAIELLIIILWPRLLKEVQKIKIKPLMDKLKVPEPDEEIPEITLDI